MQPSLLYHYLTTILDINAWRKCIWGDDATMEVIEGCLGVESISRKLMESGIFVSVGAVIVSFHNAMGSVKDGMGIGIITIDILEPYAVTKAAILKHPAELAILDLFVGKLAEAIVSSAYVVAVENGGRATVEGFVALCARHLGGAPAVGNGRCVAQPAGEGCGLEASLDSASDVAVGELEVGRTVHVAANDAAGILVGGNDGALIAQTGHVNRARTVGTSD